MRNLTATFVLFALLATPVFADHHKTTTKEDFLKFCNDLEGRWVGEVTWVADWPGLGKRGDKVTAYLDVTVAEDGHALLLRFYGGNGSGTRIYGYDARTKQIKSMLVVSGGFVGSSIVYKKDGKWLEEGEGSLPNGTKSEGYSIYSYSDNGDKLEITGSGTVGDKKQDNQHDVWQRVSKTR